VREERDVQLRYCSNHFNFLESASSNTSLLVPLCHLEIVGFLFANNLLKSRFSSGHIVSLIFVDSLTLLNSSIGFGGIGLVWGDFRDSTSDRISTLGRGQWEGPSLPSPILLGQAQEVSLKSRLVLVLGCRSSGGKIVGVSWRVHSSSMTRNQCHRQCVHFSIATSILKKERHIWYSRRFDNIYLMLRNS